MTTIHKEVNKLRTLWTGFRTARVLLTANNLGILEITKEPSTPEDTSITIKLNQRAVKILLDALVSMGILKKLQGKYSNTALTNRLLVKDSPFYQGDILRHADTMWQNWSALDEVVKTGKPARRKRDWDAFIRGMHNISILKAKIIIDNLNLDGIKTVIDIGGGPGTYCIEFAKRGLSATIIDLPETINIAKDVTRGYENIHYLEGDILLDEIACKYDLVFISQLFHSYSPDENLLITKKAVNALNQDNPNAMIVIQEFYIEESMTQPLDSALFSINMLVQTENGRCYTVREMKGWLKQVGIKKISVIRLPDTILIVGKK